MEGPAVDHAIRAGTATREEKIGPFHPPQLAHSHSICDTAIAVIVRNYLVKGRVQGVGFRWFVLREASALELRGWVRNTDAGHVEVMAAGTEAQLQQLYARLQSGSRGSRVDGIQQHERPANEAEQFNAFEIEGAW